MNVLRSECLYKNEIIGIESIYTVINGKQINIPEKVEALRKKGRDGLLTCPCGCGTKLILVAGDKNLRQQHFRAMNGSSRSECTLKQEGQNSIDSKVVIKCWLADKMDQNIVTRVPVSRIADTDRKYEVSHYVPSKRFAVNYTNMRINLEDEKLDILDNIFGKEVLHIVDNDNLETFGQYPEFMNKIQNHQNYCLYLQIDGRDYDKAFLNTSFYVKDIDGLYQRIEMCQGPLKDYSFTENRELLFNNQKISEIYEEKRTGFLKEQEEKKKIREERRLQMIKRAEEIEKERQEREEKRREKEKLQSQYLAYLQQQDLIRKQEEDIILSNQTGKDDNLQLDDEPVISGPENIRRRIEKEIDNYIDKPYIDKNGDRWFKCTECGKVGRREEFKDIANARGTCLECDKRIHGVSINDRGPFVKTKLAIQQENKICPWCGSVLVRRNGRYGSFWGCSAYPKCSYTRNND